MEAKHATLKALSRTRNDLQSKIARDLQFKHTPRLTFELWTAWLKPTGSGGCLRMLKPMSNIISLAQAADLITAAQSIAVFTHENPGWGCHWLQYGVDVTAQRSR